MDNAFDRKLRQAAVRFHLNLVIERLGVVLLMAGTLAVVTAASYRLLAWPVLTRMVLTIAAAAVLAATAAWWVLRRPSRLQLAIILDQRLNTKERFSTAPVAAGRRRPLRPGRKP